MWMINNGYAPELPHIDGIGIIRVDKYKIKFQDLFLNAFIPNCYHFIISLMQTFLVYVESYYRTISTDYMFVEYDKNYLFKNTIPLKYSGGTI